MMRTLLIGLCLTALAGTASAEPLTLVAWAPGYPGDTEQAQPSMDEFAHGIAAQAGWPASGVRAIYHPEIEAGRALVERDADVAMVPLAVYLEFGEALGLRPLVRVVQDGAEEETWSLVARKGALASPADLDGWSVQGLIGFSPRFVRTVLASWGPLPAGARVEFKSRVLSALRKSVAGENVAALLDSNQVEALPRLPFAADVEVVATSAPMVSSLVCAVGDRLSGERERALVEALLSLAGSEHGAPALAAVQLQRFEKLDAEALAGARRSWGDASD